MSTLWPYATPGITDTLFDGIPGIPMSPLEVRVQLLAQLRLKPDSVFWDIGAGTGTLTIEAALCSPQSQVVAIERDEEVTELIQRNCDRFEVRNVKVLLGSAPECLFQLSPRPDRVCVEGGKSYQEILSAVWEVLPSAGRVVCVTSSLEGLYQISESLARLQARQIEVVQPGIHRLEKRGMQQVFAALDPVFLLSGEKF
jgi:cobalt-precorrin-6B (C15)-methyltransferase